MITTTIRKRRKKLLFQQGPMTPYEAETVSEQYRKRGKDTVTTPAIDGIGFYVFVYESTAKSR